MNAPRSDRRRLRSLPSVSGILAVAFALVLGAGCTEKLVTPPPPEDVLGVPDSIQAVFTTSCALSNCHAGTTPQMGMSLADARTSWLAIVGVPSVQRPQYFRIEPGDSLDSYIVMKLRNDPRKLGQPMPLGAFPLDSESSLKIAAWAQAGAPGQVLPAARTGRLASR
jgi:hypothetical protein